MKFKKGDIVRLKGDIVRLNHKKWYLSPISSTIDIVKEVPGDKHYDESGFRRAEEGMTLQNNLWVFQTDCEHVTKEEAALIKLKK